ncbi:MAG: CRISPR-associated helicase Cas3', partial [Candidatus Competibacteraceae bacterium]|nr:CRISPR-associated helicase Cas3' [Candidatus Competibacteraceae bacterium]
LTVPTGGGKTLASLAFALDHALRHGQEHIIYVIPFTSIVEQNAAIFRAALGEFGNQAVLEHHSAFVDEQRQDRDHRRKSWESREKLKLAMENWDAPIVVTTAVQFFESLFAARPSRCRKLHHIANSVVILDEAQTLPLKLLRPCVAALDELALNYRSSVVLCTATQPALQETDDPGKGFTGGLCNVRELASEPQRLYASLKRVNVRHVGELDDAGLAGELRANQQVLCIVNNRQHARTLFELIHDQPGARHLTTLMCARHRSQILADVRQRLKNGEPCRLIATSLIEAGVDVDFPRVLRAEAGLDSIAQAAGRCNREGRQAPEASEVLIFSAPDWAPPPELAQFAQVSREVLRQHPADPLALEAIDLYFRLLYWQRDGRDSELDKYAVLKRFQDGGIDGLPFESVARDFRMIESVQQPVIIPFDQEAQDVLDALKYADHVGGIARCLQPYIVQTPRQGFAALYGSGAIQPVAPERFAEQFMILANPDLYNKHSGLYWDNPEFIKVEHLNW